MADDPTADTPTQGEIEQVENHRSGKLAWVTPAVFTLWAAETLSHSGGGNDGTPGSTSGAT